MNTEKEVTIQDIKLITSSWFYYLLSKWKWLILVAIILGVLGFLFASFDKPTYTAELTFTTENESSGNFSAYAGIAAQFGLDLGSGSSGAFEGDNLMYLMRSRKLIEKTLLSIVEIGKSKELLINYYLTINAVKKPSEKKGEGASIFFLAELQPYSRERDSLLQKISSDIGKTLEIQKVEKKTDIISVKLKNTDEIFAKVFVEQLVNNVIQYYTDYKTKKITQNVRILQRQTDSVRNLINGNIVDIAVSSDLNVNPTREIVRTGVQRKQVDAQVNGALYTELVKNLELSKLALRKETPLIQIIDTPMLPLEKQRKGRYITAIIFAFVGTFFVTCFYVIKKIFQ